MREVGLGRGNTIDFGRQVSTGESRPLKKSDGSPESKTSPSYGPSVREPQKTLEINRRVSSAIAEVTGALQIVDTRPAYIPEPIASLPAGYRRFFVTWGTVNDVVADNWDSSFDLNPTPDGARFFFAKVYFVASDLFKVASWEILTGSEYDTYETPDWTAGGTRPAFYVFSLGSVFVNTVAPSDPEWSINPNPRSVMVTEHVTNIGGTGTAGTFVLTKQLSHYKI